MTVLWFAAKPARCCCATSRTVGKRSRTASTDPSSEALSSTTISASAPDSDPRQERRRSLLLVLTIETLTSGTRAASAREATRDERLAGLVHGIRRLLPLEPREQLLHAGLERNLGAEPEQLGGQAGVRVAVADVAGPVLVDHLRLDLLAEALRDHAHDLVDGGWTARADVDRPAVGLVLLEREHTGTRDVADVDEVAGLLAVFEDERRPVVEQTRREDRGRTRVWIRERLALAVDVEEAQRHRGYPVCGADGEEHLLVVALPDRIDRRRSQRLRL